MTTLDPADIVPLRILDARRRNWHGALGAGAAEGLVSLALNLAVLAGLVHLAFPQDRPTSEPRSIAVDLVPNVPTPVPPQGHGAEQAKAPAAPPSVPATTAVGNATARQAAGISPVSPGATPAIQPPVKPEPAPTTPAAAADSDVTNIDAPPEQPAAPAPTPAPIDTGHEAAPRLVEAPADPALASTQAEKSQVANAEARPADTPKAVETPPPPQPDVLATPTDSPVLVPPPVATAEPSKPAPLASNEAKREADNTAKLAAALPFAQSFAPDMHRAALAGSGKGDVARYRGAVYGAFRKADALVDEARAKGLRGQAVIEFSVDERGDLTASRVAVSSGNPAVDETALAMIRQSAPYPPPPPGAQRTFSPAIRLGLDD